MSDHEHDHAHDGPYGEEEVHSHIGSYAQYGAVFMALIFFTLLTVGVASIHLGKANLAVAVVIASAKAALVCTFFMHLKDDNKFNTLILLAAITFIGIFFALTLNDTQYREQLDPQSGNRVYLPLGTPAPGSWENPIKVEEKTKSEPGASAAPATSAAPAAASAAPASAASAAPSASAAPATSASAGSAHSASPTHGAAPASATPAHVPPAASAAKSGAAPAAPAPH